MTRPTVISNLAMTADGKIASATREVPRFVSAHDRRRMDVLRASVDAVVVGAATVRELDPPMQVRDPVLRAARVAAGRPPWLTAVVVTASARLQPAARVFAAAPGGLRVVATVAAAPARALAALTAPHVEIWRCGAARVDGAALLTRLAAAGARRVLVEGGAELMAALVADDLVDEFHVTIAPTLLGGRTAPGWLGGDGLAMAEQRRLHLVAAEAVGGELFCRWRRARAPGRGLPRP